MTDPAQGPYKVDKLGSPEGEYWYTVVDANGRRAMSLAMHEPRADLMAYALNAAYQAGLLSAPKGKGEQDTSLSADVASRIVNEVKAWKASNMNGWSADAIWDNLEHRLTKMPLPSPPNTQTP